MLTIGKPHIHLSFYFRIFRKPNTLIDPKRRPTAEQCLKHPFFKEEIEDETRHDTQWRNRSQSSSMMTDCIKSKSKEKRNFNQRQAYQ